MDQHKKFFWHLKTTVWDKSKNKSNKRTRGKLDDLSNRLNSETIQNLISVLKEHSVDEIIESLTEALKNPEKRQNLGSSDLSTVGAERKHHQQKFLKGVRYVVKVTPSEPKPLNLKPRLKGEHKSAKMLVILQSGEQRLITFTLPKESCTVQEVLDHVGVTFTADSSILYMANPGADINYVITVDNDDFLKRIKTVDHPSTLFSVCSFCSCYSLDHERCPRCKLLFTNGDHNTAPDSDTIKSLITVLKEKSIDSLNESPKNPAKRPMLDSTADDLKASLADISSRLTGIERKMNISGVDEKPIILNDSQVGKHLQTTQPRFDLDTVIPPGTRLMLVVFRGGRHESSNLFLCPSQTKLGGFCQHIQFHGEVSPETIHVLTTVPPESVDWICFFDLPGEIIALDKPPTTTSKI